MSTTWTFQGLQNSGLDFGTITAVEQDSGIYGSFYGQPNPAAYSVASLVGLEWAGYTFGILDPGSSLSLTLSYTVTDANSSEVIDSIEQVYNDSVINDTNDVGITAKAVENVYTAPGGQLLGTTTFTLAPNGQSSSEVTLSTPASSVYVTVTLNESIGANAPSNAGLITSVVEQLFGQTAAPPAPASISSFVYCDTYGTGVYQSSDMLMSGVTVDLFNSSGSLVASAVTNANGAYSFTNLAPGTYTTHVIAPAGDTITANGTTTVTLTAGENDTAPPTGLDMPAVWDVDVVYQAGTVDINFPGATVTLETGSGTIVNTGTTDANGEITFTGLTPGDAYMVEVATPAGTTVVSSVNVNAPDEAISCGTIASSETITASNVQGTSPAVEIVKTVTSVGGSPGDVAATYAGELIDYQVVVTNTGNETLTDVVVTDPTLGTTLGTLASLAAGANVTYTAVQTVTQAEIDSGNAVPNTAVVTDTQTPSQTSTVSTPVTQSPSVSIVKTVTSVGGAPGDVAATYAGELIDYQIIVTNTGNETLTNVLVTDPTLGTTLGSLASLAPGATETYTAVATVTQSELSGSNSIPNTAVVTDTQTPSQTSTVTTPVSNSPSVSIVKTVTSVGGTPGDQAATYAGEVIDYQIVVTNTGNETLTNVVVKDSTLGTTLGTLASLAAGAAVTYTTSQTVSQADLNQILGTTTGSGGCVTHTAPSSGCGAGSTAWICSTFNPTSCANGASYTFSGITCTISGQGVGGTITEQCANAVVTFSDACKQATTTYDSSSNCWVTTLPANCEPGSVFLCGLPYTVPSGGNLDNCSITWSIGNATNNCGAANLSWDFTCTGFNSFDQNGCNGLTNYNQIGVQSCDNLNNGNCQTWSGNGWGGGGSWTSITTCAGTPQNQYTSGNCGSSGFTQGCGSSGSCGSTGTCSCTTPPTNTSGDSVINTATVTDSQGVTGTSTVSTGVSFAPAVSILKTVTSVGGVSGDPAATYAGEVIDYQIVVTNTGDETLTNVLVTDQTFGTTLGKLASLAVGAAVTYTAAATVTQAEINNGTTITNTAVVTDTQTPSQSSTVTTTTESPSVSIVKSVTSVGGVAGDAAATYAGEVIDYQVVVTNTGSEGLTNVVVKDTTLGTTLGTLASLAAGAAVTYTASQTVSQADLNQILGTTSGTGGCVTHTAPSSGCGSGSTAWICSTFNPTSCANGATYTFSGITCTISGQGVGGAITEQCANAVITFSSSCTQASTTYDSSTNCWVTTLPANCNPGSVFLSGLPYTVPSGSNLNNCNITWSIGSATNNCGASNLSWDFSCSSFNSFDQNGCNGLTSYNQIGVQSCDNLNNNNCQTWSGYGWGGGWTSITTCAGTPQNQYTYGNCGSNGFSQSGGGSGSCGNSGSCACTPPPSNVSGNSIINTATVTDSQGVTGTSTASTGVSLAPGVAIAKTVTSVGGVCGDPAATYAGEAIDYQIVVTNTGDENLTNVVVKDTTLGTTLGTIATLAVGASVTYTAAMTVTQAEINSGATIANTATVTDTQTPSQSSTATTTVAQSPSVSIVKSVTSVGGVAGDPTATHAGEVIDYKVVVTNTGDETLTNVVVMDTTLGTTLGTLASLAPGASQTYTTSTTVTQSELNSFSPVTNTATVTDSQTPAQSSTVSTNVGLQNGISVIKLPDEVVAGSCGQVTYTFEVTNTGSTSLTHVVLTDNIGTASNPDDITPVLQTTGTNGTLAPGQTWVYTATINQAGDYSSNGGSQSCSVGGRDLSSGCTAWLNSSFDPTSCANGATYTFQDITCTIKGPNCGTINLQVPNAVVTFSGSCTTPTSTFDASQNCWVTTLPAGSDPGNVFLSGLPYQVPSGTNLSGATVTWNIGDSANNCGASNVSWQTGCSGYSSFNQNNNNGLTDYNQIGVQVCDNSSACGSSGSNGPNGYCAGTPQNQYSSSNCGSYNYWGNNSNSGTCGNGSGSGSVSCGQLTTGSEADTATVSANVGSTSTQVTASDSTEVQVLASNSSITVGGTTPTGSLTSLYGTAEKLEFTYDPGNTVSLVQNQAAMASVTGTNSNSMAFLEISNNSNPNASNATIYFEGEVQSGEQIFADATLNQLTNTPVGAPNNHFSTTAGADIYAYVFSSQAAFQAGAAPIQEMVYNTSGSQNMHLGDQIGSLALVGYVGANGGHLVQ